MGMRFGDLLYPTMWVIMVNWSFFATGAELTPHDTRWRLYVGFVCVYALVKGIIKIRKVQDISLRRCMAAYFDLLIIPIVLVPLQLFLQQQNIPTAMIRIVIWSGALALLICKDGYNSISFGKAIWNVQLVDKSGKPIRMRTNIWRTLFVCMALIDVWTLSYRGYRLSDKKLGIYAIPHKQSLRSWIRSFPFGIFLLVWLLCGLSISLMYVLLTI